MKFVSFLLAALVPGVLAHAQIQIPEGASESCKKFINETLPKSWSGGFIQVPQDWKSKPSEKNPLINVFYYYDASRNLLTSLPIIFFKGGPLGHAQGNVQALDQKMQEYDTQKRHMLVIIDQRGTGCSFPLMRKPLPTTEVELNKIDLDTLRLYSTKNIVRDAEFLRKSVFGSKKWKLFGQSFGGYIAQTYITQHPEGLLEVHNHSGTSPRSMTDFFRLRTLAQQTVLQKFLERYQPEDPSEKHPLQQTIDYVHSDAGKKLCIPAKGLAPEVCGAPLMDSVLQDIGQGPSLVAHSGKFENWDKVRDKLMLILKGDYDAFKTEAEKGLDSFFRGDRAVQAFTIWSQEMPMHANLDENCLEAHRRLRADGIEPSTLPLDECRIILNVIPSAVKRKLEADFKAGRNFSTQKKVVSKLRQPSVNIPYYVYTGELDFFGYEAAITTLKKATDVVYPHHFLESGHSGWAFEPRIWRNLMSDGATTH